MEFLSRCICWANHLELYFLSFFRFVQCYIRRWLAVQINVQLLRELCESNKNDENQIEFGEWRLHLSFHNPVLSWLDIRKHSLLIYRCGILLFVNSTSWDLWFRLFIRLFIRLLVCSTLETFHFGLFIWSVGMCVFFFSRTKRFYYFLSINST